VQYKHQGDTDFMFKSKNVQVINILNPRYNTLKAPITKSEQKKVFLGDGAVELKAQIKSGIILSGQTLPIKIYVENHSTRKIQGLKISFLKKLLVNQEILNSKTIQTTSYKDRDFVYESLDQGFNEVYLVVPVEEQTVLDTCLAEIVFVVQISLIMPGILTKDLVVELPIHIVHPSSVDTLASLQNGKMSFDLKDTQAPITTIGSTIRTYECDEYNFDRPQSYLHEFDESIKPYESVSNCPEPKYIPNPPQIPNVSYFSDYTPNYHEAFRSSEQNYTQIPSKRSYQLPNITLDSGQVHNPDQYRYRDVKAETFRPKEFQETGPTPTRRFKNSDESSYSATLPKTPPIQKPNRSIEHLQVHQPRRETHEYEDETSGLSYLFEKAMELWEEESISISSPTVVANQPLTRETDIKEYERRKRKTRKSRPLPDKPNETRFYNFGLLDGRVKLI
jgi:hypothetical protein